MAGRPNHRGWIVLDSIQSADGAFCVDLFEHPDGGFGFEHFRADPEDGGRWTVVGSFCGLRHPTLAAATEAANKTIPWFNL